MHVLCYVLFFSNTILSNIKSIIN